MQYHFRTNYSKTGRISLIFWTGLLVLVFNAKPAVSSPAFAFQDSARVDSTEFQDSTLTIQSIDSMTVPVHPDSIKTDSTAIDSVAEKPAPKPRFVFRSKAQAAIDTSWRVNRNAFQILLHDDLGDLLKQVPGCNLYDPVSTGQAEYVGMHGTNPAQTLILLNGCPLNSADLGPLDLSSLPVEAIRQIGVMRDPTDSPYAYSGDAIQISTRPFEGGDRPISYVMYQKSVNKYSDVDYSDVDVMLGQKISNSAEINAGVIYKNFSEGSLNSAYETQKIRSQLDTYLGSDWHASYLILYDKRDVGVPGRIVPDRLDLLTPSAHEKTLRYHHTANFQGNVFADSTEDVSIQLYYSSTYLEFRDQPNLIDETHRNRLGGARFESYVPFANHDLTFGATYQYHTLRSLEAGNHENHDMSVYLREVANFSAGMRLKFLGKLELQDGFDAFFSPNLTLERNGSSGTRTALHVSASRRIPTAFELYRENPYVLGNPDLEAEKISSIEGVFSARLLNSLMVKSSLFYRYVDSPIHIAALADTERVSFANANHHSFYGADADLHYQTTPGWAAGLRGNLLISRDDENEQLPDVPLFTGTAFFDIFRKYFQDDLKLHGRFSLRLIGPRHSPDYWYTSSPYFYPDELIELSTDPVLDFKLTGTIRDAQLFLSVENILGRDYQQIYGFPNRKRTIYWGLTWKFFD